MLHSVLSDGKYEGLVSHLCFSNLFKKDSQGHSLAHSQLPSWLSSSKSETLREDVLRETGQWVPLSRGKRHKGIEDPENT